MQPTGAPKSHTFPTVADVLIARIADAIVEPDARIADLKIAAVVRITVRIAHGA